MTLSSAALLSAFVVAVAMEIVIFIWEKSLSFPGAHWKIRGVMAAKVIIIIAKLKWTTHTYTHTQTDIYNSLTHTHSCSTWSTCCWRHILRLCALIILFSTGFIRKLSATLSAPRRTLDIYLCKNVKSFVKLVRRRPFPLPFPFSLPDLTNKEKGI